MEFGKVPFFDKPVPRIVCGSDFLMGMAPDASFSALDTYWSLGGRCFDSAHVYGPNSNILGAWVASRGYHGEVIFFDKGSHPYGVNRINQDEILADIRDNHKRLQTSCTDFYVFHRDDPSVPVGEIVDWMNDFVAQGLIKAFGGSNWNHSRIAAANEYADKNAKQGFSLSNPNLTLASVNEPMWDDCLTIAGDGRKWHAETGFPLFAWSSMARGYFAGVTGEGVSRTYDNMTSRVRRERAIELGKKYGATAPQVALAWVLCQPGNIFALCGLRTPENARQCVEALDLKLSQKELDWLENGE